jgi:hypothetical protein
VLAVKIRVCLQKFSPLVGLVAAPISEQTAMPAKSVIYRGPKTLASREVTKVI